MSETDRQDSAPSPTARAPSLGESAVLLWRKWHRAADQLGQVLGPFVVMLNDLGRRLEPHVRAFTAMARRLQALPVPRGLVGALEWMKAAGTYCLPYQRELARSGLPALTPEEELRFALLAAMLQDRREARLGGRMPLVELALAGGRLDIAATLALERPGTRRAIALVEAGARLERGELLSAAYLELSQHILPSIRRRLGKVPLPEVPRVVGPRLRQVMNDAYLTTSVTRALRRRLARERQRKQREGVWDEGAEQRLIRLNQALAGDNVELSWDVERALASFLARPRASELDRKLVQAWRQRPESSAREIAARIGAPVRTVQYRHRKLLEHVRKELET